MAAHHQLTFTVARTEAAAQQARHHVMAGIRSWGIRLEAGTLDEIELAAGELITNAVCHTSAGPITVSACQKGPVLVVEVHDTAKVLPRSEPLSESAESGRGQYLVSVLANRHGADLTATGKRCWAEFDLTRSTDGRRADQGSDRVRRLPSDRVDEVADRAAVRARTPTAGSVSHARTRARRRTVAPIAGRLFAGRPID
ncbi:ATP-binding protein [Streptomyces jumonjinensis]|uniref:ATP-binding protein n=1 Tax=Streptomyces jumonjinensis TaxID=1945 RepID=UPI0037AB9658